jgi:hypothetical protein
MSKILNSVFLISIPGFDELLLKLHSDRPTWKNNPAGQCAEANATQHYLCRSVPSIERKTVYTLSKMISFPSMKLNTMTIQPYGGCSRRFSEFSLISPYDIIHLDVTADIGTIVDTATTAPSFRMALVTILENKNTNDHNDISTCVKEDGTDVRDSEDETDARDEDGTDSASQGISTWAEKDETLDHILTKIQEARVIVSRLPIPPPHNELPSNPHGIKRRLIIMEQSGRLAYEELRKRRKVDLDQEYNQRALMIELSDSAPSNRSKKHPPRNHLHPERTVKEDLPLGKEYRLDKAVCERGAVIGSWLNGFEDVKCIGALGLLGMALFVFEADDMILPDEETEGRFSVFSQTGNIHEARQKIASWRVGEKVPEFDADDGIILEFR